MGRHFFTGGMMPSEDLFSHFADDLAIQRQWRVGGLHYWRTCEAWLKNLDRNREPILARFRQDMPARDARRSLQRWRMFFMACAELFRYRGGDEWFVAHYLFQHAASKSSSVRDEQLLDKTWCKLPACDPSNDEASKQDAYATLLAEANSRTMSRS